MPNHFHSIILIVGPPLEDTQDIHSATKLSQLPGGAGLVPAPTNNATLGNIIGAFKSQSARGYILGVKSGQFPPFQKSIWQRGYYEHIIRNENDLQTIREYIASNPATWKKDSIFIPY